MTSKLVPNPDPAIIFPFPTDPVASYFPLNRQQPTRDTFEVGLVLGGTVSAAAYTAGVVDFLIEALDAWTVGKNSGTLPFHQVSVKIATGTSGGAIMCTLLARILGSAFPHASHLTPAAERALSPLYDCWVNQIDITDMLQLTDLSAKVSSLLCAKKIDLVGETIAGYAGPPLGSNGTPAVRGYLDRQLPIILTQTNLRGIPYSADFRGVSNRSEYFTDHADHIRFLVDVTDQNPPTTWLPFEIPISAKAGGDVLPWSVMIHAARGSSAFPIGLPPQVISRNPQHYRYRYAIIDGKAQWLKPAWPYMIPIGSSSESLYQFLAVDGGCFNNEPISYARDWLEGIQGLRVDDGDQAHRALLLVDPFADIPDLGLVTDDGILSSAGGTLAAFTSGARYETADFDLFTADNVYSRFLVNPVRKTIADVVLTGGDAIATNTLAAFGGFLSKAYREHDYLLGRRNCQQFLRANFVLPEQNTLFNDWTRAQREQFATGNPTCLPIIPLAPSISAEIPQPMWPKGAFDPLSIKTLMSNRIGRLSDMASQQFIGSQSFIKRFILKQVLSGAQDAAVNKVINLITQSLKDADLLA